MWTAWRTHFEHNATRLLPAAPDGAVPAAWRDELAASLARFQLGEAGEGRVAKEIDRVVMAAVDDDYRASLKMFVREEGRHARILAGMVRALGGTLLRQAWSERLFVAGRRVLGLRAKLLVLLVAGGRRARFLYDARAAARGPCDRAAARRDRRRRGGAPRVPLRVF